MGRPPTRDLTEPRRSPDQDQPADMAEAVAVVLEGLGPDNVTWTRTFHHHTGNDGGAMFVDEATGLMYDTLPRLNQTDGKPEDPPRKG